MVAELLFELSLRENSGYSLDQLPILKEQHLRDVQYTVFARSFWVGGDVNLANHCLVIPVRRKVFKYGMYLLAGCAPFRSKVENGKSVGTQDFLFKIRVCNSDQIGHVSSSIVAVC